MDLQRNTLLLCVIGKYEVNAYRYPGIAHGFHLNVLINLLRLPKGEADAKDD